jgi:hypothetical protein
MYAIEGILTVFIKNNSLKPFAFDTYGTRLLILSFKSLKEKIKRDSVFKCFPQLF